jgi:isopentenyl diphosphate isomerase/L-lactate dehydrogenase-like FMN-dependent dehydrogenase
MAESLESRFQNLHEFVTQARTNLDRNNWDYLIGGSETETTLARNRLALDAIGFRPRVLRDVSNIDCSSTLFGKKLRIPVLCAPVGSLDVFEPGGGATVAEATRTFGNGIILSSVSHPGLDKTAEASATASRSSSFTFAATPPGSMTMSAARSTRATTRFA